MTLQELFDECRQKNLKFHGLYEEDSGVGCTKPPIGASPDTYGTALWNCRLSLEVPRSGQIWKPMGYGGGPTPELAIERAIRNCEHQRALWNSINDTPSAPKPAPQRKSFDDLLADVT